MVRLLKVLLIIALIMAVAAGCVYLFREAIIKTVVETVVSMEIGAPVSIDSVKIENNRDTLIFKGFKIYNPKGYPDHVLMKIKDMNLIYDREKLREFYLHVTYLDAEIGRIVVIKNKKGELNINALKLGEDNNRFHIDVFELSIDQVVYEDHSQAGEPDIKVYDVKIKDKSFHDIPSMDYFFNLILQQAIENTAIKGAAAYGIIAAAGVTFWPAGAAIVVLGKDSASASLKVGDGTLFNAAVKTLEGIGKVNFKDEKKGTINATSKGFIISVKIVKKDEKGSNITVSARKLVIPSSDYAKSVLYQISEELPRKK